MRPLAEHETVIQVLREMVEDAILRASPALATVTAVSDRGQVYVRLFDEETARPLAQARNPAMRLSVGDTVLVIRTLANDLVVVCPVADGSYRPLSQRIGSEHLADGAVTTTALANGAVTQDKLATGSVGQTQLRANSVLTEAIGAGAVTFDKIQTGAVGSGKIAAGAVGNAQIQGGAVTADKIASGVIPPPFVPGPGSITNTMLAANSVTSDKIAPGGVQPGDIGPAAVGEDQIAANAVVSSKIKAGAVIPEKLDRTYANQSHNHQASEVNGTLQWNNIKELIVPTHRGNKTMNQILADTYRHVYP